MNKKDKSLKMENLVHTKLSGYFSANYSNRKRHTKRLQPTKSIYSARNQKD